jgi:hypothetical protein
MTSPNNGMLGEPSLREYENLGPEFDDSMEPARPFVTSSELRRYLAEVKGQAQFLLYLADQIEESLEQLANEADACHGAFLCKVLAMYSGQLEVKHQGLGEKVAEACQEVYVTVREREMA